VTRRVTVDFFTLDKRHDEYVMYLVEEGPWPSAQLHRRLSAPQDRVYDAVDVAIDGHLAKEHPESSGMKVRIQIDLHDDAPAEAEVLVKELADRVATSAEYMADIDRSPHLRQLRIVVHRPGEARPN
jgi:hypothetical protein